MRPGGLIPAVGRLGAGLTGTAATVAALTAVARLVSLAREIAVAARFGAAPEVDAFVVAFAVPSFLSAALVVSMGPAVVPALVRAGHGDGEAAVRALLARLTGAATALLLAAAALAALAAPVYLPLFAFPPGQQALVVTLALILALVVPLQGMAALWTAALHTRGRFALPALTPALTPLAAVAALLAFGDEFGIVALAAGMVAGGCLELAVLAGALARRRLLAAPAWGGRPAAGAAAAGASHFVAALVLGLIPLADQLMAAAAGTGGAATFAYGSRLTSLISGIGMLALGQALLPLFAQAAAAGDGAALRRTLREALALILLLAVPGAVLVALASDPIMTVMYQRGSFDAAAAAAAAEMQRWFVLQVPFYLAWVALTRLLVGLHRQYVVLALSGLAAMLNFGLNLALRPLAGVAGIAAATTLTFVVSAAVCGLAAWWALPRARPETEGGAWKS
ncbi:MAG: polysaccharide biosynthesis C-terminal domain-containing protein [Rhodospirillales bacterium]|nr:polysaccharide biosynthesis C-terminal domain-containing protein [Rhodospirillales bacterium]